MKICKVVGSVWATKKDAKLEGAKLMLVAPLYEHRRDIMVAADCVGAGIGENVLVVTGSTARFAAGDGSSPIDATIVGIIDCIDLDQAEKKFYPEAEE